MKRIPFVLCISLLLWPFQSGAAPQAEGTDAAIKKVLVVFKTHLDIGFTELGSKTIAQYQQEFIPAVLELSEQLSNTAAQDTYPWTTGSWLIWDYLENASPQAQKRMEEAIRRKDFWWHALPFTIQAELCDSSLFSAALVVSGLLDSKFDRTTKAAKITDVPGLTRASIPLFRKHGITLLHLGSNPGAAHAQLPELFRWMDESGNAIHAIYQSDYAKPVQIPGTSTAVVICFTHDNHGPHSEAEIEQEYTRLKAEYPNAEIVPASLNAVADEVEKTASSLPVITQEWGDTWIYGIASDPKKIAELRQLMRLRKQWIDEKKLTPGQDTDLRFTIPLLLVTEHTWGLDVKTFLRNYNRYEFDKHPEFPDSREAKYMEESWNEKRAYIAQAVAALPPGLRQEAIVALAALKPERPVTKEGKRYTAGEVIETPFFEISFDSHTGAINYLNEKKGNHVWADHTHTWGEFAYQIYSGADFSDFISRYCPPNPEGWMLEDYGKPGLDSVNLRNQLVHGTVKEISIQHHESATEVQVHFSLDARGALYGAPHEVFITYSLPTDAPSISIELQWFEKEKNRIPEAVWFSFRPQLPAAKVYVDKLDTPVDVQNVVENGARNTHAITNYVSWDSDHRSLRIESLDAPLVKFNERQLLQFDNRQADPLQGVHFCLLNTLWGTNYPQWFGDDMKFRFILRFE